MTISSTTRTAGPFVGAGNQSVFGFDFKIFAASDIRAIQLTVATGVAVDLTLTSQYTVALNGNQDTNPGGTVTLVGGNLASGLTLTIVSNVPDTQPLELANQGGFYPHVITDALDRSTIQVQQAERLIVRGMTIPESDGTLNMTLPTATTRAGKALSFDGAGLPTVFTAGASAANIVTTSVTTLVGTTALVAQTTGTNNTAIGSGALSLVDTGTQNVGLGGNAGDDLTSGTQNVVVGYNANAGGAALTNSIVVGAAASGVASNTTIIGTSATLGTRIFGVHSTGDVPPSINNPSTTIAPVGPITAITGATAAINRITPPSLIASTGGSITLIANSATPFTLITGGVNPGNIGAARSPVNGTAVMLSYSSATGVWYPH